MKAAEKPSRDLVKHLVWKWNEKGQIINDDIYFLFYLLFILFC